MYKATTTLSALTGIALFMSAGTDVSAATIAENFDSTAVGSAAPTGWSIVGVNGTTETYATAATGNLGNSGNLDSTAGGHRGSDRYTAPNTYIVNSGDGFDATQDFSGSFDFYLTQANVNDYSTISFILGDVQNGLSNTSAGEYLHVGIMAESWGYGSNIMNGTDALEYQTGRYKGNYAPTTAWVTATFSWTAATKTFEISWPGADNPSFALKTSGYEFDSNEVFFGFGTINAPAQFDNINITGTLVPEPGTFALLSLGGLFVAYRRRR